MLDNTGSNDGVRVQEDYVTVEWLEIKNGTGSGDGIDVRGQTPGAHKVILRNNLVHNVPGDGIAPDLSGADWDIDIYNNIIYDAGDDGITMANMGAGSVIRILNNTIYSNTGDGIFGFSGVALIQNNISHSNGGSDFAIPRSGASSNNLSGDITATAHSPAGGEVLSVLLANVNFVDEPGRDLHIQSGSAAELAGADLSAIFRQDIDGGNRVAPWDIGADEIEATTAVELVSFEALGIDGAVSLNWETASELDNLGFHLYRSLSEAGPYERITATVIPGLGSSPEGARYSYVDSGLTNGVTYYYQLEDIETTGVTELHGPVSATPEVGAGTEVGEGGGESEGSSEATSEGSQSRITYGDPEANELLVHRRGKRWLELELLTEGFYAIPQEDGTVLLETPGFEDFGESGDPDVPVYRTWQDVVGGRNVTLVSVEKERLAKFTSLRPSSTEPVVVAGESGTVQTGLRKKRRRARGVYYPEKSAQLMDVGFQGAVKKALVELAPMRWDETYGRLVLVARRLVVRIAFQGKDRAEVRFGRSHREVDSHANRNVLARFAQSEPGLYGVSFESVYGTGTKKAVPTSELRLAHQGEAVAFYVSPNPREFGPRSTLYFVSQGASENPYGHEAVYQLESSTEGVRMEELNGAAPGCVPRSVEEERHPPLRHQSIISGGNLRAFENLAQTLVAVEAS